MTDSSLLRRVPSVDEVLRSSALQRAYADFGHALVVAELREVTAAARAALAERGDGALAECGVDALVAATMARVAARLNPSLRQVFNLTGTVLHTNLGRAPLPEEAIAAMTQVARGACNLEYDLDTGRRGERDSHVETWLKRLTGAQAAVVVNNNAAAVMLVLNTLARGREVPVSRGELVEIGGAFRIPDVMTRAGARLREVGTTNRTHRADFEQALGPKTALVMKVHASNYAIEGFTAAVAERELAALANAHGLPFVVDLGSGTLIDLSRFGLPHEPTVGEALAAGADLVTFSGDKLLGGPQAGIIAGRADLIARIQRNPLKRALRVDKLTLAALDAVLKLYSDPARAVARIPSLRVLTRAQAEIAAQAERLAPRVASSLGARANVSTVTCMSQIGSGALPVDRLPSAALALAPTRARGRALERLAQAFRALPRAVIGRMADGRYVLDLRTLDDEAAFVAQLEQLDVRS